MNIYIFSGKIADIPGRYMNIINKTIYTLKHGDLVPFGLKGEFQILKLIKQ